MALVVAIAAVIVRLDFPDMHCGSRLGTPGEPNEQSKYENVPKWADTCLRLSACCSYGRHAAYVALFGHTSSPQRKLL